MDTTNWVCSACTFINTSKFAPVCEICETKRPCVPNSIKRKASAPIVLDDDEDVHTDASHSRSGEAACGPVKVERKLITNVLAWNKDALHKKSRTKKIRSSSPHTVTAGSSTFSIPSEAPKNSQTNAVSISKHQADAKELNSCASSSIPGFRKQPRDVGMMSQKKSTTVTGLGERSAASEYMVQNANDDSTVCGSSARKLSVSSALEFVFKHKNFKSAIQEQAVRAVLAREDVVVYW